MSTWPPFDQHKNKNDNGGRTGTIGCDGFPMQLCTVGSPPNFHSWRLGTEVAPKFHFKELGEDVVGLPSGCSGGRLNINNIAARSSQGMPGSIYSFSTHPPYKNWSAQDLIEEQYKKKTHPPSLKDLQRHAGYSVGLDLSEIFPITTAVSMLRCSHVNYAYYGRSLGDIGSCSMLFIVYSAEGVSVLPQCCE